MDVKTITTDKVTAKTTITDKATITNKVTVKTIQVIR